MNEVLGGSKLNYRFLLISIIVSCCMLATIATATPDTVNVVLSIDNQGIVPGENDYHITFHEHRGMSMDINGFFVTLDPNTTVDSGIDPSCINVSVNGGTPTPVRDLLAVIDNRDPNYKQYDFLEGTTSLKFLTPVNIPFNSDVRIDIVCGLENECPCPPNGYMVWVNHDGELNATPSNSVQLQVEIEASAGDNGTIDPEGIDLYDCGETPVYTICPKAPCYEIASVLVDGNPVNVTPISGGCGTYTFAPLNCSHTIKANFTILTSDIDYSVVNDIGGTILSQQYPFLSAPPNQTDVVNCSDDACYTITADPGYIIKHLKSDGSLIAITNNTEMTYCFNNVTSNHSLNATFGPPQRVFLYLKYQQPLRLCQGVYETGLGAGTEPNRSPVFSSENITPVVEYADSVYLGGNSSSFDVNGTTTGTTFGSYSAGTYTILGSSATADSLTINLLSAPSVRPETYKFTYSDGTNTRYATLVILPDGTMFWGAAAPTDVISISAVEAQIPAWEPVTQAYLDAVPDFEGLIGAVIYVSSYTYQENFKVDTPALHLKNMPGQSPIIDANGLKPVGSGPTESAVFLSAGCTGIEGFTVKNSAANGIAVYPSSEKCSGAYIHDFVNNESTLVPCSIGRVNIISNEIFDNADNGIRAIECVVLINDNQIYANTDDGIDGDYLYTGVECIDPEAFTHSPKAASEIIYNNITWNGHWNDVANAKGIWNVTDQYGKDWFTQDPSRCGELPGWTDSGIQIRHTESGQVEQTLYIAQNNITYNYDAGIFLWSDATDGSDINITGNKILDNRIFGISTRADNPGRITVMYNDIVGNRFWGIKNWVPEMLIAKENYWGMPGGPDKGPAPIIDLIPPCYSHEADQRSDALGNGDNVSHYVEYNPWLYIPAERIFHDVNDPMWMIRAYGSDSLQLQQGWNTFSVPTKLYDWANEQSEIMGLGDFLTNDNFEWMIWWDASSGHWEQLAEGGDIVPCQGYYIKMKAPSKFPVLYGSVSPGLPSYHLVEGWNLIGAPWGIDREDDYTPDDEGRWAVASPDFNDPEAFMPVNQALESIKEGAGGTKGVAIIISPSVPGQYSIWSSSITSGFWQIQNTDEMVTGDGYWAYMVNPATYAGFEITPFYLTT